MNKSKSQIFNKYLGFFFMDNIFKKLFLLILITPFISSCNNKKDNFEIDISKLNLPNKKVSTEIIDKDEKSDQEEIIYKLKTLKNKKEIMGNIKYGKKDPFSNSISNARNSIANFQLKGFISIKEKNYALVSYQEKEGVINIDSVGGLNTNLIPNKSFIKEINPQKELLKISLMDELYSIKISGK